MKPKKVDEYTQRVVQDLIAALEAIAANEKGPPWDKGDSGKIASDALARYYLCPMIRPRDR